MKAALTEKGLRQSIYVNPIERTKPAGTEFLAEWTKSAGTEFLAERTELDADGQEKEKVRKAEKGMDFNNHCIADDSDQYWRTGDQFCDDRDKK